MLSSPIGIVVTLVVVAVVGVVVVAIASVGLAISGGPGACTPGGGPISVTSANAQAFQQKWDAFDQLLESGSPSAVTFTESEVSSRADQFVKEETDVDVDDLRVCFHDGFAEVSGKLNSGIGVGAEIRMKGSVDLSSDPAKASVDKVEVGSVPGFLVDVAETIGLDANDGLDEVLGKLDLQHSYQVVFKEGTVEVTGSPKSSVT